MGRSHASASGCILLVLFLWTSAQQVPASGDTEPSLVWSTADFRCPGPGWYLLDTVDPSSAEQTEATPICVKVHNVTLPWSSADAACHVDAAHLLSLHVPALSDPVYGMLVLKQVVDTLETHGVSALWVSMRKQHGKLWWMDAVPRAELGLNDNEPHLYQWGGGQPDDQRGDCGQLNMVQQSPATGRRKRETLVFQMEMELTSCERSLPFLCVTHAQPTQDTGGCGAAWTGSGTAFHDDTCLYHSGDVATDYVSAQAKCESMGGELAAPVSASLHDYMAGLMGTAQATKSWIGLTQKNKRYEWASRQRWEEAQSRVSSQDAPGRNACFIIDTSAPEGQEWVPVVCNEAHPYICQKHLGGGIPPGQGNKPETPPGQGNRPGSPPGQGNRPGSGSVVTVHPRDLVVTSDQLNDPPPFMPPGLAKKSVTLTCHITNLYPGSHILWVKDGIYLDNGPAPAGFTLTLGGSLLDKLIMITNALPSLDGLYHCEAWGKQPYKRIQSQQALVQIKDVVSIRSEIPAVRTIATSVQFSPLEVRKCRLLMGMDTVLLGHSHQTFHSLGTVTVAGKKVEPELSIDRIRPGDEIMDITYRYQLPGTSWKVLEELAGVCMSRRVKEDELLYLVAQAYYDALRRQMASLESVVYWRYLNLTAEDVVSRTVNFCTQVADQWQGETLMWPITELGQTGVTYQFCISDGTPYGTSRCRGNYTYGAYRTDVAYYTQCQPGPESKITGRLKKLMQTPLNETSAEWVGDEVVSLTAEADQMVYPDVTYTSLIMENIAMTRKPKASVGEKMVKTLNNLMFTPRATIKQAQKAGQSATRLLQSLELYSERADLGSSARLKTIQPRVAVEIVDLTPEQVASNVGFSSNTQPGEDLDTSSMDTKIGMDPEAPITTLQSGIIIPEEALTKANAALPRDNSSTLLPPGVMPPPAATTMTRVTFTLYADDNLFGSTTEDDSEEGDDVSDGSEPVVTKAGVNSMVISASINGVSVHNLSQPVEMVFIPTQHPNSTSHQCVFWDFSLDQWSGEGCQFWGMRGEAVVCHCDHLTNFAILTDPTQKAIPEAHRFALSIITYIGLALSIFGLTATIVSFLAFKKLRKGRSQKVLFNLALAILCTDIIFLAGADKTESFAGCAAVAALLHYFILASFAWMLVEAILQYLRFVKVLDTYVENFMWKVGVPAWVLPAVPVAAVAGYDYNLLRGPELYCWLSLPAFYYAFLIPVGCIIIINTVVFILVVKGITCDRPAGLTTTQTKGELAGLQVRAAICCFVVLGLTWVFGFLAVSDARLVFQYLFCIFNALQGLFIFIFHNLRERAVRRAWRSVCCPDVCRGGSGSSSGSKYLSTSHTDSSAATGFSKVTARSKYSGGSASPASKKQRDGSMDHVKVVDKVDKNTSTA